MNKTLIDSSSDEVMRLDKWLWCARFFKSRQLAVRAIKSRNVMVNGTQAKPARTVTMGDYLVIDKNNIVFEIRIIGLSRDRLSAPLAANLYQETDSSIYQRQLQLQKMKLDRLARIQAPKKKPDKRSRRKRAKLKRGE